jgi:aminopeptidase N
MHEPEARPGNPELKQLVTEASRALARLDASRLEELALSCQALTRSLNPGDLDERKRLAGQAREAQGDMAVFARVLEATRANLNVMTRLREIRAGRLEYTERQARGSAGAEGGHGDN